MSNCILCFNHDKRNKFIVIKENLSESLTVADAISQHFPYIDILSNLESNTTCLSCYKCLKSFCELQSIVKASYSINDVPVIKCESFESKVLNFVDVAEPFKALTVINLKEELKLENIVMFDEYVINETLDGIAQIEVKPKGRPPPKVREEIKKTRAGQAQAHQRRKQKLLDDDDRDQDFLPRQIALEMQKKQRDDEKARMKILGLSKPAGVNQAELKRRKKLWDADEQKIREFVDVKCHLCNIPFETYGKLSKHFKASHPEYRKCFLTCCGKRFTARYQLLEHIELHLNPHIEFRCFFCPTVAFQSKRKLEYHMRWKHLTCETFHTCETCGKKCRTAMGLVTHLRVHVKTHPVEPRTFECFKCHHPLRNSRLLHYHMRRKHSDESEKFVCEICSHVVRSRQQLLVHARRHKEREIIERGDGFNCPQCSLVFAYQPKLDRHVVKVHDPNRPMFICEICSKELRSETYLKEHIALIHGEETPRVTCFICGNTMKNEKQLKTHIQSQHRKKEEYVCKDCGHRSKTSGALWSHIRFTHKLQRNLPCRFCPKMFKQELDVKEHEATHTGIDLYQCDFCPKTFKFGASYRGHRKREHPVEYELHKPKWMKPNST